VPTPAEDPTPPTPSVPPVAYAAAPRLVVGVFAAAAFAALLIAFVDGPGELLLGVVAVVLAGEATRLALVRPVIRADGSLLEVHTGTRRQSYSWSDVDAVRARTTRRLVSVATVEIDLNRHHDDALVVVPAYRLGAPPDTVVAALERLRGSAGERMGPGGDDGD
jgi:hypothetical protein